MMQFLVSRLNFSLKLFPLHINAFIFALRFSPFVISNYRWFYQVEILLRRMKLDLVSVYRWMRLDRHMVSHCRVWSKMSEKNRQSHNALLIMHMCVRLWVDLQSYMFFFILCVWCAVFLSSGEVIFERVSRVTVHF